MATDPHFSCDYGCNHKNYSLNNYVYNVICLYCNARKLSMQPQPNLSQVTTLITQKVAELKSRGAHRTELSQKVCEMIFFDLGEKPSAGKVLSYINQGSMTDIGKDVELFWQGLRKERREAASIPGVPEAIGLAHSDLLQTIWGQALAVAKSSFDQEKNSLTAHAEALEMKLQTVEDNSASTTARLDEARSRQMELEEELRASIEQTKSLTEHVGDLEHRLLAEAHRAELVKVKLESDLQNLRDQRAREVDGLSRDLRDARVRMDAERQQLAIAKDRTEKELAQSNQLLQSTRQQLNQVRDQNLSLSEQREKLITQLSNEVKELKAQALQKPETKAIKQSRTSLRQIPRRKFLGRKRV